MLQEFNNGTFVVLDPKKLEQFFFVLDEVVEVSMITQYFIKNSEFFLFSNLWVRTSSLNSGFLWTNII